VTDRRQWTNGPPWKEFRRRADGFRHALSGGLWLHRFRLNGEPMAHLVSSDRNRLLEVGRRLGLKAEWLQDKPLKHPDHSRRVAAWHWDLLGRYLERVGPPPLDGAS
jgi:hypothetical protein